MAIVLIGLDDTDNPDSRGTGHLARLLSAECGCRGMRPLGVTRHQFLLDERIPYTSHNSGACVAVETDDGVRGGGFAFEFVANLAASDSDPGVCVAEARQVTAEMVAFGRGATERIVETGEAQRVAREAGISLRPVGGTGLGVIGALGSVALRAHGNEGRYIDLPGLRELPRRVRIEELSALGIGVEHGEDSRRAGPDDVCDTMNWIRPRLVGGSPVLVVKWSEKRDAWVPVDTKKSGADA